MATVDGIDWVKWLRVFGKTTPELDDPAYDAEWVTEICGTAVDLARLQCPGCVTLLADGELPERMFAYVICQAVLRTVRQPLFQKEDNGSYSYDRGASFTASPDLWFTDKEKAILEGLETTPTGSVQMGVDRVYGR